MTAIACAAAILGIMALLIGGMIAGAVALIRAFLEGKI
jgi:LPS O-antigen subunit length determinant protein (WzzB/FepE family)